MASDYFSVSIILVIQEKSGETRRNSLCDGNLIVFKFVLILLAGFVLHDNQFDNWPINLV